MPEATAADFLSALCAAVRPNGFQSSEFFADWFRSRGAAYTFVFKKNLKATNIQLAELVALLRSHTVHRGTATRAEHLQFVSPAAFRENMRELVASFTEAGTSLQDATATIFELYEPQFRELIAIEPFFGSCAVFVPPTLEVDLTAVCAYSGYVHSCGLSVYIRSTYKATEEEFFKALDTHLAAHFRPPVPAFFSVYCHEDFTGRDASGLDDLRIFIDKAYMGPQRLVTVVRNARTRYEGRLKVVQPDDRRNKGKEQTEAHPARTIWLLMDYGIGTELRQRSDKGYFVCYDQLFHNENPFHLFDEDKPAWIDHTTIPHTLVGAMLNLARPWRPTRGRIVLGDPFVGTGTTLLEGLKFSELEFRCSDWDLMSSLATNDNLEFFSASASELATYKDALIELAEGVSSAPKEYETIGQPASVSSYLWVEEFFERLSKAQRLGEALFSPEHIRELQAKEPFDHLVFYLFLRTARRNVAAFDRGSLSWRLAFRREVTRLAGNIDRLRTLRDDETDGTDTQAGYRIYQGRYSKSCSFSPSFIKSTRTDPDRRTVSSFGDARDLEPESCDVIVTDPPYGFNTVANAGELAQLYVETIQVMLRALKGDGDLVFALPDWSHTGRQVPFFVRKEFVVHQVILAARRLGMEVVNEAYVAPMPGHLFRAPYYWESDRALRRAILHFRVRRRHAGREAEAPEVGRSVARNSSTGATDAAARDVP